MNVQAVNGGTVHRNNGKNGAPCVAGTRLKNIVLTSDAPTCKHTECQPDTVTTEPTLSETLRDLIPAGTMPETVGAFSVTLRYDGKVVLNVEGIDAPDKDGAIDIVKAGIKVDVTQTVHKGWSGTL